MQVAEMRLGLRLAAALVVLASCTVEPVERLGDDHPHQRSQSVPAAVSVARARAIDTAKMRPSDTEPVVREDIACRASGASCEGGQACCEGAFCSGSLTYAPPICTPVLADGEFCMDDDQCASGHCVEDTCQTVACSPEGQFCYGAVRCCEGLFCDLDHSTYGQGSCRLPLPAGAGCSAADECESGECTDGLCATAL